MSMEHSLFYDSLCYLLHRLAFACLRLDQQEKSGIESFLIGREGFKDIYRNILKNSLNIYLSAAPGLLIKKKSLLSDSVINCFKQIFPDGARKSVQSSKSALIFSTIMQFKILMGLIWYFVLSHTV